MSDQAASHWHDSKAQQTAERDMDFLVDYDEGTDQTSGAGFEHRFRFWADDPTTGTLMLEAELVSDVMTLHSGGLTKQLGDVARPWTSAAIDTITTSTVADTHVFYSVSGVLTGDANHTWNSGTKTLTLGTNAIYSQGANAAALAADDWALGDATTYLHYDHSLHSFNAIGGTFVLGTKTNHVLRFKTNDTNRWQLQAAGDLIAIADDTYNIGATATTFRPASIFVGTAVNIGNSGATAAGELSAGDGTRSFFYRASVSQLRFAGANTLIGTTSAHNLTFMTGFTSRWTINTGGHIFATTDNANDFGFSGANRPRTFYIGTSLNVGNGVSVSTANGDARFGDGTRLFDWDASDTALGLSLTNTGMDIVTIGAKLRFAANTSTPTFFSFLGDTATRKLSIQVNTTARTVLALENLSTGALVFEVDGAIDVGDASHAGGTPVQGDFRTGLSGAGAMRFDASAGWTQWWDTAGDAWFFLSATGASLGNLSRNAVLDFQWRGDTVDNTFFIDVSANSVRTNIFNNGTTTLGTTQGDGSFGITGNGQLFFDASMAVATIYNSSGIATHAFNADGETVLNEASANINVRMEGNTTNDLFKLHAGNDSIGINKATPTATTSLDVVGLIGSDQQVALGGGVAAVLGAIGGAGPTTAAQFAWWQIELLGANVWVAVWI